MKTATVTAGSRENPITVNAQVNSVDATAELTPDLARSFARIAFGHTSGVTVSDGNKAYRLSGDTARLVSKGGRPALSTDEGNVKVEIVMPASLRDKLDRLAPNNRSAWIRQAIEQA